MTFRGRAKVGPSSRVRVVTAKACCVLLCFVIAGSVAGLLGQRLLAAKSDVCFSTWSLWVAHEEGHEANHTHMVNFPFGAGIELHPLQILNTVPTVWLASISSEVFAVNFVLLMSFVFSGIFTMALIHTLTKRVAPSIVCGLAYMILPYNVAASHHYLSLARVEVFPLFLLSLVWFLRRPRWFSVAAVLLVQFFSFSVDAHYGLFTFLILLVFLSVYLFYQGERGWSSPSLSRVAGALALAVSAAGTGVWRFLRAAEGKGEFALGKPFEQLYAYSARVWDYFVPPAHHPLLGRFTSGFIEANIHESFVHVQTLYLGLTLVALAGLGAWWLWRSRVPEHRFLGVFLPVVAVGAFLFSMPPTVDLFGVQLPMPGLLLYRVLPMFRVYARFGVVLATATIVLAGFGMAWLLERVTAKKTVAVLLGGLVLFEFLAVPEYVDLSQPPAVYQWLAEQDEVQAIVEYPLSWPPEKEGDHLSSWDLFEYMLWQRVHRKAMFNGNPEKLLDLAMKLQLGEPAAPNTPVRLGWLGITHIIIHKERLEESTVSEVIGHPDLELVYEDEQAAVLRIAGSSIHLDPQLFKFPRAVVGEQPDRDEETVTLSVGQEEVGEQLLVYGPYIALYEGHYRVRFELEAVGKSERVVTLSVVADGGRVMLAESHVSLPSDGEPEIDFQTAGVTDAEFRICSDKGTYTFTGVLLEQQDSGLAVEPDAS